MGSGHFLVTAVDFLSDYIAELIEYVPAVPEWLEGRVCFAIGRHRDGRRSGRDILHRAGESDWVMDESQLTDQAIIRRMVLKRCIYGVDKSHSDRRAGQGLPVAAQLHRGSAAIVPGPPPALRRLPGRPPRVGGRQAELNRLGGLFASSAIAGAEAATSRNAAHRGDIRRRRRRGPGVGLPVPEAWRIRLPTCGACSTSCTGMRWLTSGMKTEGERRIGGSPA